MKLSACMIVKNEQAMLPRCLESIRNICDELIVVDTGSEDRTVEIAESFGAQVFHHPWQNDFSLHRNQSIGYASGDWILIIDADEELVIDDPEAFRARLDMIDSHVGALAVRVQENGGKAAWLSPRFFRASANPVYKFHRHNKAVYDGEAAGTDLILNHYGYSLTPERMREKHERALADVQKRLDADPNDYDAMYFMAQASIGLNDAEGTVEWCRKCLQVLPLQPSEMQYFGVMYFWGAMAYLHMAHRSKGEESAIAAANALQWATKAVELFPNDIDSHLGMARVLHAIGRDEDFLQHADRYLELVEKKRAGESFESDRFCNPVMPGMFDNRTIYGVNPEAEARIRAQVKEIRGEP